MPPQSHLTASSSATVAAHTSTATATASRRQPASTGGPRKRAIANADDAAYHSTTAATKRSAADKGDGEHRAKRKRVDHIIDGVSGASTSTSRRGGASGAGARDSHGHGEVGVSASAGTRRLGVAAANAGVSASGSGDRENGKSSLIDFNALPTAALHRYLAKFDLIPELDPLPSLAIDPIPPSFLTHPRAHRQATSSPPPASLPITPANRPRRESGPGTNTNRRRSSRMLEDEGRRRVPILNDVGEVHAALAALAERHFRSEAVREVDTLTVFMCAVRAKGHGKPAAVVGPP